MISFSTQFMFLIFIFQDVKPGFSVHLYECLLCFVAILHFQLGSLLNTFCNCYYSLENECPKISHHFPDDDGIFLKIKKTTSLVGKCSVIVELMLYREKINSTINMCCKPN